MLSERPGGWPDGRRRRQSGETLGGEQVPGVLRLDWENAQRDLSKAVLQTRLERATTVERRKWKKAKVKVEVEVEGKPVRGRGVAHVIWGVWTRPSGYRSFSFYSLFLFHPHSCSDLDWTKIAFDDPLDTRTTRGQAAGGLCILRYLARTGTPGPSVCLRSHPDLTSTLK